MPLKSQLHVDKLLSQISVKYANAEFIADRAFPVLPVENDTDKYRIYQRNFRLPEANRADKAKSKEFQFEVSTATYSLKYFALKDYVTDNAIRNYDIADLRADTVENLTDAMLRIREKQVADLFTSTSWSLNVSLAATAQWSSNTVTSNPVPQFDTAATTIIQNSGQRPNYAIIPRNGYVAAKSHVSILDRVKYTSSEMTPKILQGLLDVEELLVPIASYDTSNEGLTESITSIWDDNAFLGYKPNRASPLKPSAGYIFQLNEPMVKRWRDEEIAADAIEVNMKYVAKVVSSLSGYLIKDLT